MADFDNKKRSYDEKKNLEIRLGSGAFGSDP